MTSKAELAKPIYTEQLNDRCALVVYKKSWHIEYNALTFDEDKDMKYKVDSFKISQYLSDLKKNLKLYFELMEQKGKKPMDVEGLRDMILRIKGEDSGVYLSDTFRVMTCEEDYERIEHTLNYARKKAEEVMKEYEED